jgi:salicylate hydroxylase
MADPNGFRIWRLVDMDEIPRWSNGHVVMLGGACHPVSPFGFSRASMSIEGAMTLAILLPARTSADEIQGR